MPPKFALLSEIYYAVTGAIKVYDWSLWVYIFYEKEHTLCALKYIQLKNFHYTGLLSSNKKWLIPAEDMFE